MSQRKTYHVEHEDGEWKVEAEHAKRASGVFETKAEAIGRARELAQAQALGQVIVHKKDGEIQTEWTYGQDPFPPKG
jgi:uncharacterized protein YdaT